MSPAHAAVVFMAAAATDWVWAYYTREVGKQRPAHAAFWAVGIILCSAVAIVALAHSGWYVIPEACGGAVGTGLAVARHRRVSSGS